MSDPRNTEFEERLAAVLFDATSGMRSNVSWDACMGKGLWLADAASILGAYQQDFLAAIAAMTTTTPDSTQGDAS